MTGGVIALEILKSCSAFSELCLNAVFPAARQWQYLRLYQENTSSRRALGSLKRQSN